MVWGASTALLLAWVWSHQGPRWLLTTLSGRLLLTVLLGLGSLPWWCCHVKKCCQAQKWLRGLRGWWIAWGGVAFSFFLALIPPERLPWGWRERQAVLLPVWVWLALGWGGVLVRHPKWVDFTHQARGLVVQAFPRWWRAWLVTMGLLLGGTIAIAASGWGIRAPWPLNWQGYPVPLLPQYLFGGIFLLWGMWWGGRHLWHIKRDFPWWLLPLALWGVAVIVWWFVPPTENYFLSLPMPPNHEPYYPSSDAAIYFFRFTRSVYGWGYGLWGQRGMPFLRRFGLYTWLTFPALSHLSFLAFMLFWVALLAVEMVAAYFVGKQLHSRSLGVFLVLALMAREVVAMLAARRLDAVHVKNLMSEPLLRLIFLALISALIVHPPSQHRRAWLSQGLLLGALAGWAVLVRVEAMVPALIVLGGYTLWAVIKPHCEIRFGALAALVGLALVWAPWMWRSSYLSRKVYKPTNIYYGSPWFFSPAFLAAASPEYRYLAPTATPPPLPTATPTSPTLPTPTATTTLTPPAVLTPTPISSLTATPMPPFTPPPTASATPTYPITPTSIASFPPTPSATPTPVTTTTLVPSSTPTFTPTPTPFLPIERVPPNIRQRLLHIPVVGSLLRWWGVTWQQWWWYIGRNIVTSWTAWPWSARFYTPLQAVAKRPLADGQPFRAQHMAVLIFNLTIWSLGWTAIWRRDRWAALAPWVVYGAYVVALAFGRTAGGRYIVPIDWIPLAYYLAGWLVLAYALWRALGQRVPKGWWQMRREETSPISNRQRAWGQGALALGLVLVSAFGVGIERYEVWRADRHPEWTPPRRRVATLQDVATQMTAWGAWSQVGLSSEEFWTRVRGKRWQAVWGFGYFPRYLAGGERGGEWIHHEKFEQDTLFLTVLSSRGVTPLALPMRKLPMRMPLGSETIALVCRSRAYDKRGEYVTAVLLTVRDGSGTVQAYVAPDAEWHCP